MSKSKNIPLAIPDINDEDISAVTTVLKSGMLVQGKKVNQLEEELNLLAGSKHCVTASNGTATLHMALKCLDIGPGDEVIVPALSYVATANVVELVGAKPVFIDVAINALNINVSLIEQHITAKTKAIIPVHEFGYPADMDEINRLAKKHNLFVIEDAACALGTKYKGQHVGTLSDFGSFSFHPRKSITSGEGGCLLVQEKRFADKLRILRNHGIDAEKNAFVDAGFNYRMTDFQAAILISQLKRFDKTLALKRTLVDRYKAQLEDQDILFTKEEEGFEHAWQTFHIILPDYIDRDKVITLLREEGIGSNYGAQCIPALDFYLGKYQLDSKLLYPNALRAYQKGLALPLYLGLKEEEIDFISKTLINILANEK